jgi:hypothetical protein
LTSDARYRAQYRKYGLALASASAVFTMAIVVPILLRWLGLISRHDWIEVLCGSMTILAYMSFPLYTRAMFGRFQRWMNGKVGEELNRQATGSPECPFAPRPAGMNDSVGEKGAARRTSQEKP